MNGLKPEITVEKINDSLKLLEESNELLIQLMKVVGQRLENLENAVKKQGEMIIHLM